jgi:hypothetical protein
MKKGNEAFAEKLEREGIRSEALDPFEKSDLQVETAMEYLSKEPKTAILKAWAFGMTKNLFSPAVVDMSYLLNIERPHFFYTKGRTLLERGWNFIKSIKGFLGWAIMGSLVWMTIIRPIQFAGWVMTVRRKPWEGLILGLIMGYFLLVSGPVGYAKYRLPFEPVLIVFLAIGLMEMGERLLGDKRQETSDE